MNSERRGSAADSTRRPDVSVVVVSFNMRREIPRTLHSLSTRYQRNIGRDEYEVILVDNGSDAPWEQRELADIEADLRIINLREASRPSPCAAINAGLRRARGKLIGVIIDGARMVTPGLLDACRRAARIHPRPVIATLSFHLGPDLQLITVQKRGYTQAVEDRLLDSIDWPHDGYRLFEISVFGGAFCGGWLRPTLESNALFMPAELWEEMEGYEERFQTPGGGIVNQDTYERALDLPDVQPVMVLGEASFHQVHGGVAANSPNRPLGKWLEEYRQIRGRDWRPPTTSSVLIGKMPPAALNHLDNSVRAVRAGDFRGDYILLLKKILLSGTNLCSNTTLGLTMIDYKRMDNLHQCIDTALRGRVTGDLVDCGLWPRGAGVLMRGVLKASGVRHRNVWVADPQLADSLDRAKAFFESLGLLDESVRFLPGAGVERIAVLRLDGSAIDALSALYSKVSTGGFVIIDDYGAEGVTTHCARVTEEFRSSHGITAPLRRIDESAVFWHKQDGMTATR